MARGRSTVLRFHPKRVMVSGMRNYWIAGLRGPFLPIAILVMMLPGTQGVAQTIMFCELENSTTAPGSEVLVNVYVQNAPPIRGFQTRISVTRLTGTGSVAVECPTGVADPNVRVDSSRPDYLFHGESSAFTVTNCTTRTAASAILSGGVAVGGAPAYLSTYVLKASSDALGESTFAISVDPSPGSAMSNPSGSAIPFNAGTSCTLTIQSPETLTLSGHFCSQCVRHPGIVKFSLDVSSLSSPINGVQALFSYDPGLLSLNSAMTGNGQGSPWDAGTIVQNSDNNGDVTFAVILNGMGSQADATVATFSFSTIAMGTADLAFRVAPMPFNTKLTTSLNATIIPTKVDSGPTIVGLASKGDVNGDGMRDGNDVQLFTDTLLSPGAASAEVLCASDLDGDALVTTGGDLDLFVECLIQDVCVCP